VERWEWRKVGNQRSGSVKGSTFPAVARTLAAIGRRFDARGWVLGTSGNFSAVVARKPLRLAISASGVPKRAIRASDFLEVDATGRAMRRRSGSPSAETRLHLEIVRRRGAGCVLHTHSVWGTMLSDRSPGQNGFWIEGYEMLKGLDAVATHAHREWIPVIDNDQDMGRLAAQVGETLVRDAAAHAFLLRRHGLYTWGATPDAAERHVEILEFLFETIGRMGVAGTREAYHGAIENS
jgi:methylthioribulose-1-phosphate dehydratase